MIRLDGETLLVETSTLRAQITRGFLTSLRDKQSGAEFVQGFDIASGAAVELVYANGEIVGFGPDRPAEVVSRVLSERHAEVRLHGWDADGIISVRECPETGALLIEPSAYSSRPGVLACRWRVRGVGDGLELVAPLYQGVRLALEDDFIRDSRWPWPVQWEAGLAILQGKGGGFWVHTQDTHYRYKALKVGEKTEARCLGFDTEAYGPLERNLAAGGVCWRVNVHQGDWQVPAREYRQWLWRAYSLEQRRAARRAWTHDIALAIGWCDGDVELLDALASKVDPKKVLVHFSNWRTDAYDENYPTFEASEKARRFLAKGAAMGFHIMPHCNSIDMDPTHPLYERVRDFAFRDPLKQMLQGWAWDNDKHTALPVPNSGLSLMENRQRKVMVKIHPGLSAWRSILAECIGAGLKDLATDTVFIDVTLCTWNLHNCLVEDLTSSEGMRRLIDAVAEIRKGADRPDGGGGTADPGGLVVGGEGLNEIIMQGLSFAQVHMFPTVGSTRAGLERTGGCALNALLFEGLTRTFGYSGLSGKSDEDVLRSRVHLSHGAMPTITRPSAQDIIQPNAHVRELLEMAAGK